MNNPLFVDIVDPRAVIADKNGELWLPISESPNLTSSTEMVNCAGVYFDVVGFSEVRGALLLSPVLIDGAAAKIEDELEEFIG